MMELSRRHATSLRQPARTNHSFHLVRLGVTVVSVKPPRKRLTAPMLQPRVIKHAGIGLRVAPGGPFLGESIFTD